jgi:hypothetical protein
LHDGGTNGIVADVEVCGFHSTTAAIRAADGWRAGYGTLLRAGAGLWRRRHVKNLILKEDFYGGNLSLAGRPSLNALLRRSRPASGVSMRGTGKLAQ